MKKFISILLCAVLLSTFFTVFTVPAMALEYYVYGLEELYDALDEVEDGDKIIVKGFGGTWYVNESIEIGESCTIEFHDITFDVGDDGDGDYNDESLILVDEDNITLDFYNCTISTLQFETSGDGGLVCDDNGSAIYVNGDNCTIDGHDSTVFDNCRTNGEKGGAIYIDNQKNCTIKNATFINCESTEKGGAIYIYGEDGNVGNCKFSGCEAPLGGWNIYSESKGKTYVGGCTDTNGNPIVQSTCINCMGFDSVETYRRKTDPTCLLHLALPEEGVYIIRSAVDQNYCFDTKNESVWLRTEGETSYQKYRLERARGYDYKKTDAFIIRPAYWEYGNEKYAIGVDYIPKWNTVDEVHLAKYGYGVTDQQWYFEDDAPGDNCYYIHNANGGWLEAAGCVNGVKPTSGCDVLYTSFTGEQNQVWILERIDAPSGSTISEGNTWIIAGFVAVAVVVVVIAVVIAKKKKKPAPAEGEVTVTETTEKTGE